MTQSDHDKAGPPAACFLCGCTRHRTYAALTSGQLKKLWKAVGITFPAEAWPGISDTFEFQMHQCNECGFLFFDRDLAGNEAFYRTLDQPGYYSQFRDEFARTIEFARDQKIKRVLDVGCGSGIFLDKARNAGFATFGVDLNSRAADVARQKGHTIFERLLSDLTPDQTGGKFDMITLLQVLEHVPDPVKTVREAKDLLTPGGFISIAVPSATGVDRLTLHDPSVWPPHHLSLWRVSDFFQLAKATGMRVVESGSDMLLGSAIEMRWKLRNQLAPVLGHSKLPGGAWLPALVSALYRKLGLKFVFPRFGPSVYTHLRNS